jgi:hypothetical protein
MRSSNLGWVEKAMLVIVILTALAVSAFIAGPRIGLW